MKIFLLILSILTILFTGCAKPELPEVHTNANGQACTYYSPYSKNKLDQALHIGLWGIFTTLGGKKECLTPMEWARAEHVGSDMAGSVAPLIIKQQQITNPTLTSGAIKSYYPSSTEKSIGCNSNIDCGIGSTCVIAQFSSSGTCMKQVNIKGVEQFNTNGNTMGIKTKPDCRFDTECPISFSCINGSCVK